MIGNSNGQMLEGRVLDTNMASAVLKEEADVVARARQHHIYVPVIVWGELYFGAYHSARASQNLADIEVAAASVRTLDCTIETSRVYGQIKAALRAKGRPIPENDIWIAALAVQHGLTLVSRDKHFQQIDGLAFEQW
jgi:tRNA(fMet)-specific endonuclease VapC